MMDRLRKQGVNVKNISITDGGDDEVNQSTGSLGKLLNVTDSDINDVVALSKSVSSISIQDKNISKSGANASVSIPSSQIKEHSGISAALQFSLSKMKSEIKSRGAHGFIGIQRKFKIMDDNSNNLLDLGEFKKAMAEMNINISSKELHSLFDYFDVDHSGSIDINEFVRGLRGPMNENRVALVHMAFDILDKDGSGVVDAEEIANLYDASKHPDVIAGRKTHSEVLREFLDTFDVGGTVDGKVTRDEFTNYYSNVSASIDSDEYFELMIRNAWHISGGVGAAANSANRRVLVTHSDGTQSVEEIKNDLGLKADDKAGMMDRLRKQGVSSSHISIFGGFDEVDTSKNVRTRKVPKEEGIFW
jgi:Ca2+-binding EF-hand superfamily protein